MNQATDKSGSIRPGFSFHTENTFRVAARESRGKPWRFVGFPASIRYLHHGIVSSFALDRSSLVFVPFVSSLLVSRSSRGTGLRDAPVRRAFLNSARASPSARTRAIHFDTSAPQRFFDSTGTYCERRTGNLYEDRRCRSKFSEIDGEIRSPWLRPRSLDPEPSRMDARLRVQLRVRRIRIECARNCNIMVEIRIFFSNSIANLHSLD